MNNKKNSSFSDLDSDFDGLPDPCVYTSDEEVEIWEINDYTGKQQRSK